jgi:hypothetical protein
VARLRERCVSTSAATGREASYLACMERWLSEVISWTAVVAGANPQAVQRHLLMIMQSLMKQISSREGNRLFDDSVPNTSPRVHK